MAKFKPSILNVHLYCTDDLYSAGERKVRRAVGQRRAVFWAGRVLHALLLGKHMQSGTYLREACLQFFLNRFYRFLFFLRGLISCNRHIPVQNRFLAPHRNLHLSTRWRYIQRRLQCLFQKYWSQAPDYLWNIPCFCGIQFLRCCWWHRCTCSYKKAVKKNAMHFLGFSTKLLATFMERFLHEGRFQCKIDAGSYRISLRSPLSNWLGYCALMDLSILAW